MKRDILNGKYWVIEKNGMYWTDFLESEESCEELISEYTKDGYSSVEDYSYRLMTIHDYKSLYS